MTLFSRPDSRGAGATRGGLVYLVIVAVAALGFVLGWKFSQSGFVAAEHGPRQLRQELGEAQEREASARRELAALRTRSEVDRQSLELVRREMVAQKEQITELEDDLRFYRSLMSPESVPGQVQVRAPEISSAGTRGHYTFRMVLHQEAVKHQLIRGELTAGVEGEQDGEAVTHVFTGEDALVEESWPEVRFRYFQEFTGSFELPEGFVPAKVFVAVNVTKPRKLEVREEFPWLTQEKFSDVGK